MPEVQIDIRNAEAVIEFFYFELNVIIKIIRGFLGENFCEKWLANCRHCNHSLLEECVKEKLELARLQKQIINTLLSDSNWGTPRGYLIFWHRYLTAVEKQKPDCAEARLKLMDTILKKPLLLPDPNYYSQELLAEMEWRLQIVTLYLSGISSENLAKKFGITPSSIEALTEDVLESISIDEIIKRQFGNEGKFGLEIAQGELWAFKAENGRLPKTSDKVWSRIEDALFRGDWVSFGIKTWNDLLMTTFGEVNQETRIYLGEQGLERAIAELRAFRYKHGRLPTNGDKIRAGIKGSINRRAWISFGIVKWNDLLMKTFGEVNNENGIYLGEQGLERAIAELRAFRYKHGRLPKSGDKGMGGVKGAVKRGEWVFFGIRKWNDLLRKVFGEVNKERGIYTGKQGLKRVVAELRSFKTKHGRVPTTKDKGMAGIIGAIGRKEWVSFGIMKWSDLRMRTFGTVYINGM